MRGALAAVAGMAAWGLVQLAAGTTVYAWATEQRVAEWVLRGAALYAGWRWFREEGVLKAVFLAGFGVSVAAVLMRFLVAGTPEGMMWPFAYHNQYAAFQQIVIAIGLWLAFTEGKRGWLWGLLSAWMIASVILANSRAGAALAVLQIPVAGMLGGRFKRMMIVLAAVAVFTGVVGWERLWEKLGQADPYAARRELLLSSMEMTRERPWLGWGLGTWATVYPAFAKFDDGLYDNQAHNDWAQWAAEGGLPFVGLMVFFVAALARPAVRSVWGIGLLSVLAHCAVEYHFQQRAAFGYFYFAMAGAVLSGYGNQSVSNRAAEEGKGSGVRDGGGSGEGGGDARA
jgi:O-antigen ligase